MQRWLHAVALQGQALRVFEKNLPFLASLEKCIFSKKPCVSLCLRPLFCIPFFFFSVFLFSGCQFVRCALLCPPRTAPPPRRPHPPSHRTLGPLPRPPPNTLAPGSRWRTGSDRQPTNRRRRVIGPQSVKFGRMFRHRWGTHRGTKPRNEKRFSLGSAERETKSVSRCQSIKKPIATKWPSARVEILNHQTMIFPNIAFFASDKRFLLHLRENNGFLLICLLKRINANNTLTII